MADAENPPVTDHLPRTEAQLAQLNVRERVLLAVATASGSNAVAYYAADGKGGFGRTDHLDLYDLDHKNPTPFPAMLQGFGGGTFRNEDAVRRTSEAGENYQIAVTGKNGEIEGIIVLHPPQDGYMRVQNQEEARKDSDWRALPDAQRAKEFMPDLHESATIRLHKLQMASDIIERDKEALLHHGEQVLAPGQAVGSRKERDETLLTMAKDLAGTFPTYGEVSPEVRAAVAQARSGDALRLAEAGLIKYEDNMQAAHLKHTGDLMKATVDGLNDGHHTLNGSQRNRAELLAMVHDAGKLQSPYTMFQELGTPATNEQKKENTDFGNYSFATNANHDFLDKVLLPLDPSAGNAIGNHHHGNRNTEEEWKGRVGEEGIQRWEIHDDHNVAPQSISTLSRMLRVDDVTEAITARGPKSLAAALRDMTGKAVAFPQSSKDSDSDFAAALKAFDGSGSALKFADKPMDPNSIDKDALCFMIEHHVFENYGRQRDEEEKSAGKPGWPKYNADELKATQDNILEMLHWDERKKELVVSADGKKRTVEDTIRHNVQGDQVFSGKGDQGPGPQDASQALDKAIHAAGRTLARFGHFLHSQEAEGPGSTPAQARTVTKDSPTPS